MQQGGDHLPIWVVTRFAQVACLEAQGDIYCLG